MARWTPLLKGDEFAAPDRVEAELIAAMQYGSRVVRVISSVELDIEREEAEARLKRRRPKDPG